MPLTSAERKRKYLEKLKANGTYETFKRNKAASEKMRRDRIKSGLEKLPKAVREKTKRLNRAYKRKKGAEYRLKKKGIQSLHNVSPNEVPSNAPSLNSPSPNSPSPNSPSPNSPSPNAPPANVLRSNSLPSEREDGYKTKSALDKAVAKIKRAVPSTSAKKKQAICKYLKTFEANDLDEIVNVVKGSSIKSKSTRAVSCAVIDSVKAFYERDDISRMSPNMRDCRQFVDPLTGLSEMKQIRHLMYRLIDVYDMFVKHIQNGDNTVKPPLKASKFFQLRPNNVKLMGSTPLASCFCLYHTNFILCCDAMNRYLPEFPKYGKSLEQTILCEPPQKDCWWQLCKLCSDKAEKKIDEMVARSKKNLRTRVVWTQWSKSKETNRFQKNDVPGALADLRKHFLHILPEFLKHSYIKRSQEASFQSDCDDAKQSNGRVVVVQIDFAESYTCQSQDEIQSAHWNQANV